MKNNKELARRGILKTVGGASVGLLGISLTTRETTAQTRATLSLSVSPTEVQVREKVTATVRVQADSFPTNVNVGVNWGDGTIQISGEGATAATFIHSYDSPGTYTIRAFSNQTPQFVAETVTVTAPGNSGDAPGQNKIEVCHNGGLKEVPQTAVDEHLEHGDTFPPCEEE